MFIQLEPVDRLLIWRAFFLVFVVVIIGVTTAENQINNLTQNQDTGKAFGLSRDGGSYAISLLGEDYHIDWIYPVGRIYNNDEEISLEIQGITVTVPLRVYFNLSNTITVAAQKKSIFIKEGMKTKRNLEKYFKLVTEKIRISL